MAKTSRHEAAIRRRLECVRAEIIKHDVRFLSLRKEREMLEELLRAAEKSAENSKSTETEPRGDTQ